MTTSPSLRPVDGRFRLAVAQLNPTVGDVAGNLALIRAARVEAAAGHADLVLYSELIVAGYPTEDLVLKRAFVRRCMQAIEELAAETADGGPAMLVGTPWLDGDKLHNAVALLDGGKVQTLRYKYDLPNYGVFDEKRVFKAGPLPGPVDFRGVRIGVPVCEDIWNDEVCECLAETGAEMLLVPNGSPYWGHRAEERLQVVVARVVESGLPLIYCNQLGGQDELVFDGGSFALQADRSLAFQLPQFETALGFSDWVRQEDGSWRCENGTVAPLPGLDEANWRACVMGLGDYVRKNGFPGVVLGLSGGIDSAICAAMAVDALGADKVHAIMLPYRYTSKESIKDAADCAQALGIRYDTVPIAEPVEGFGRVLAPLFTGCEQDTTEENLQSRARGVILMAISNKFGSMVVTTGNKSEMSVGYATLYGDMNGGYNPVKDLYKTQVFHMARWRNANRPSGMLGPEGEVIPDNIITKVPTAELRENQTDQDSLPPYDVLDDILSCLVEHEMAVSDIEKRGHDRALIHRIEHLLYIAEYKRRQAPPGVKITERNFGRDRRYPITNRFRDRS
ncbi:NAD+ synthase [Roseibium litorale]|uniref:Glutamine-dependent NAD(+) synthetase n=1 Tax=Roseibium litorale TaxID=2803841 RepID=A0ABR9CRB0_9HYPH|nr:NAD+ synthase [Roseibium litorale]MBD8892812.1 NAD+ synthase [Roseibium litorale]